MNRKVIYPLLITLTFLGERITKFLSSECASNNAWAPYLVLNCLILSPANLKLGTLSFSRKDKSKITGFFSSITWSIT